VASRFWCLGAAPDSTSPILLRPVVTPLGELVGGGFTATLIELLQLLMTPVMVALSELVVILLALKVMEDMIYDVDEGSWRAVCCW